MYNPDKISDTEDGVFGINQLYNKAQGILDKDAINPMEFDDTYKDVAGDMELVAKLELKFANNMANEPEAIRSAMKKGKILEAIIHEQGELAEWFGENATTIVPSRYDDVVNGVDNIVEFREERQTASYLALAIDVVAGTHVREKINRIKKEIGEGHLTEIKYFKSDLLHIKGKKTNVPRVVIGAEQKNVDELMRGWFLGNKQVLANHFIQIAILKEIRMQLVAFAKYAREKGGERGEEIASIYEHSLEIINEIIRSKRDLDIDRDATENDAVFQGIKTSLEHM